MFVRRVGSAAVRRISTTSSAPNSDVIQTKIENLVRFKSDLNCTRWAKIREHNNNRALSTLQTKAKPQSGQLFNSKDESRDFMATFPDIVRHLTDTNNNPELQEVAKHYAKVLQYNVPNGKKNRGLAVVNAYKMLEDPDKLTPENIQLANVLGWCVEMAFLLVSDDIMDHAELRRGSPCWYKMPGVGLAAVNDASMLENGVFHILKMYFREHPCYVPVMEIFHDVSFKTIMGQTLDNLSHVDGKPNLDEYTMKRYNAIVKYKTAYYSFQLPVALAMYLAGKFDPEMHRQAKTILLEMGHFFQVQDDFLDCFGNKELTGKGMTGGDIREGKCTWLVVVALQRATPAQKQILVEHYGRPEEESIQAVRTLYEELSLPTTYAIYEEESFNLIRTHIQQISKGLPHNIFFKFMEKIYKREC